MFIIHLVVNLPECWSHFVGQGSSNNDHISLARGGSEHDSVPKQKLKYLSSRKDNHDTCPCRILGQLCASSPQRNRQVRRWGATENPVIGLSLWILKWYTLYLSSPIDQIIHSGECPLDLLLLEVHLEGWVAVGGGPVRDSGLLGVVGNTNTDIVWGRDLKVVGGRGVGWPEADGGEHKVSLPKLGTTASQNREGGHGWLISSENLTKFPK